MPRILTLSLILGAFFLARTAEAMSVEQRWDYLEWMKQNLPDDPEWNAWQKKSGELPPDFDALKRSNGLPDPLRFYDGRPVQTAADWSARRVEIRQLLEKYDIGTLPPKPPVDRIVLLDEQRGAGYLTRNVRLKFGSGSKGAVRVQMTIPDGGGPMPV